MKNTYQANGEKYDPYELCLDHAEEAADLFGEAADIELWAEPGRR